MRRFEGKVALVTAAAQGIGQAVVRRVAAEGGAVVVMDLREDAAAAGAEHALGVKVDVTSRADVDAAVAAAVGRFGRLRRHRMDHRTHPTGRGWRADRPAPDRPEPA